MIKWIDNLTQKVKNGIGITLNEGFEVLKRKKKQNKETREAHERKEFPIHYTKDETIPDQSKQQAYLKYALSLIKQENPLFWNLLMLRMEGVSHKGIAKHISDRTNSDVTVAYIKNLEFHAIKYVQKKIEYVKKTGIPLFEGKKKSVLVGVT